MFRIRPRLASFLALGLIGLIGMLLILKAMPQGLGLSDDSIAYIAGARSMLAGEGYREAWLASDQPVTHFPPAFSSLLALVGLLGIDPLHSARWINALLFGLNAALLGILAWRMTPWLIAGLVLAALFIASGEMFQVHAVVMSEPFFIFLSLLAFWMFDLYYERDCHWLWLIACGTFVGLAYLTRYAGLALVATFCVALLILHDTWRKRLVSMAIFLASFIPWALGWAIRNRIEAGNATNRAFAWHPITAENIQIGLRVVSEFFIPVESWRKLIFQQPAIIVGMIVIVLGTVLVWLLMAGWKYFSKPQQASIGERGEKASRAIIPFTMGLYIFAYLASIIASMSMFDAATRFKLRILSPIFVSLLVLLVYLGIQLLGKRRELFLLAALIFLAFAVYKQSITVNIWPKNGLGYASFQWYDSKAMEYLRILPEDVMIYTNEPGAVYLYTGRGALVLPDRYDSATALARTGFQQGVQTVQMDVNEGRAVLAMFDHGDNVSGDVSVLTDGLFLAHRSAGDSIYTAKP